MPPRILVGPIRNPSQIGAWGQDPHLRVFTYPESWPVRAQFPDALVYEPGHSTLHDLLRQMPAEAQPDVVLWWHHYSPLPLDMALCPCLSVLIVADSHAQLGNILDLSQAFDLVVGDLVLVDILRQKGVQAEFWPAFSYDSQVYFPLETVERELDIAFVGSFKFHPLRNALLYRLSQLSERYQVYIDDQTYGADYNALLNRSKIVVNYSIRKEINLRSYEAARCGALLFYEAGNLETPLILPPGECAVVYDWQNLEAKLDWYLAHPRALAALALAGQERIQLFSYEKQFAWLLESIAVYLQKKRQSRPWSRFSAWQQAQIQAVNLYQHESAQARACALRVLEQSLQTVAQPLSSSFWNTLALVYLCQAPPDFQAARACLTAVPPGDLQTQYHLAWLSFLEKDYTQAYAQGLAVLAMPFSAAQFAVAELYSRAYLPYGFNFAALFREKLWSQTEQGDAHLAVRQYELLLWNTALLCGQICLGQAAYAQAKAHFLQAWTLLPQLGETSFLLAFCQAAQTDYASAFDWAWQGLAQNPLQKEAWLYLDAWLTQAGDAETRHTKGQILQKIKSALPHF
ncbi:MAG: glycosyltransferase [Candidatus Sericytochromatia bacterium]